MDVFITLALKKKNMNAYIPCVVGAFIAHALKKKNMNIPNVVNENDSHWNMSFEP